MKVRFWLNNIWTWKYVRYIFYYILSSDVFSRMTFFICPNPILDIGAWVRFLVATLSKKKAFSLLALPKQMQFLTISTKNGVFFLKT